VKIAFGKEDLNLRMKYGMGARIFDIFNIILLICLGIITLYPFYYVAIVSLSSAGPVSRGEIKLFPVGLTLKSYEFILKDPNIVRSFLNTIRYTSVGTLINLLMSVLCAYPLSIKTFSGRKVFTKIIVFTMFFTGGLIPTYLVVKSLNMIDTIWAIVLPGAISTWNMFIMRTYFMNIPDSLRESCYIDGANDINILINIILPLSLPVLGVMMLFYASAHWNSFFPALIYLNNKNKFPFQLILRNMLISQQLSEMYSDIQEDAMIMPLTLQYSAIIVSVVPILLIYPFIQRYFTKGIMIGSLKG